MPASDPENDDAFRKVKTDDGFAWKHEDDITDEDDLIDQEPSEDLLELLGTRQAKALARSGLTTIEGAVSYHQEEGDLTDLDDVGQKTVDELPEIGDSDSGDSEPDSDE